MKNMGDIVTHTFPDTSVTTPHRISMIWSKFVHVKKQMLTGILLWQRCKTNLI